MASARCSDHARLPSEITVIARSTPDKQRRRSAHQTKKRFAASTGQAAAPYGQSARKQKRRPGLDRQPRARVDEPHERQQPNRPAQSHRSPPQPVEEGKDGPRQQHEAAHRRRDDPAELVARDDRTLGRSARFLKIIRPKSRNPASNPIQAATRMITAGPTRAARGASNRSAPGRGIAAPAALPR